MKNEFNDGFIANIPIALSVFVYGSVLGILCIQKDISLYELVLMNVFIFAGSAQFVMVDMWSSSLDIIGIILAALMINLRYFLIGASLNPLFVNSTKKEKFKIMHFVTDECWAITMNRLKSQKIGSTFLFGGGVCIFAFWFSGTILGYIFGDFISDPSKYGLDFAFISIFTALIVGMYKSKKDIFPWIITALIAVVCEHYMGGKAYIVIAAIVGSLCAVFFYDKDKNV